MIEAESDSPSHTTKSVKIYGAFDGTNRAFHGTYLIKMNISMLF